MTLCAGGASATALRPRAAARETARCAHPQLSDPPALAAQRSSPERATARPQLSPGRARATRVAHGPARGRPGRSSETERGAFAPARERAAFRPGATGSWPRPGRIRSRSSARERERAVREPAQRLTDPSQAASSPETHFSGPLDASHASHRSSSAAISRLSSFSSTIRTRRLRQPPATFPFACTSNASPIRLPLIFCLPNS